MKMRKNVAMQSLTTTLKLETSLISISSKNGLPNSKCTNSTTRLLRNAMMKKRALIMARNNNLVTHQSTINRVTPQCITNQVTPQSTINRVTLSSTTNRVTPQSTSNLVTWQNTVQIVVSLWSLALNTGLTKAKWVSKIVFRGHS